MEQNTILGSLAVGLGIAGWVLPYRFNPLRLRRFLAGMLPERVSLVVPKVLGTVLILGGIAILFADKPIGQP